MKRRGRRSACGYEIALPPDWRGAEKIAMHLGYNQNVVYRGETYHVQTEDGGRTNPVITTHLFRGGVILATRRTAYDDILESDRSDEAIKELMVEQHKRLVTELKEGALDSNLG